MKIAITGGAGFIGSNIADAYISAGHEVVIIDNLTTGRRENINPEARFIEMDIRDGRIKELFEKEKFDILNHHAAQMDVRVSVERPTYDADVNILGTLNLLQSACENNIKKVIFASSAGVVYGEQDYFPADEEHPKRPCSPYGVAKLSVEYYLGYYKQVFGIPFAALRYTNVYGPRQNPYGEAGVVGIFTKKMLSGGQPYINGDGKTTRDYVFVHDVVQANILALNDDFKGIYNISTGVEKDVNYIFHTLKKLTGSNCNQIHSEPKLGEQRRSVCSFRKINEKYGWSPKVNLEEGLRLTVDWFKANG